MRLYSQGVRRPTAILCVLVTLTACSTERPEGDAIVVAMTNSAINLDPRVGADDASQKAHQLLYNSLVKIDANLKVVPELAESLKRPDDLTYVATLRHGVRFHDGGELTANDVAYTFRSFLDPAFRGRSGAYTNVRTVEIVDP
jgi:peptide/nickel transport system substrate-binding protein